ncbi:hypothetical protein Acr_04g0005050 [Actinidia rufa]|uniref:Uncharacterized protein n=1 Tax=Actinidia rufa TaxID=165716 RepID=A0A7J0EJG8_9ERIC|nr:hypothetical protein Acr_04g0005050 [Actinidia rufa]
MAARLPLTSVCYDFQMLRALDCLLVSTANIRFVLSSARLRSITLTIATIRACLPIYLHIIPHRAAKLDQIALSHLQILEPTDLTQCAQSSSSSDRAISNWINVEATEFAREEEKKETEEEDEGEEAEVKKGEEAISSGNLASTDPILVLSSDDEAIEKALWDEHELGCLLPLYPDFSSQAWTLELSIQELSRRVTLEDSFLDFETYLVVMQATMLPRDIAELQKKDGVMAFSLAVMKNLQEEDGGGGRGMVMKMDGGCNSSGEYGDDGSGRWGDGGGRGGGRECNADNDNSGGGGNDEMVMWLESGGGGACMAAMVE